MKRGRTTKPSSLLVSESLALMASGWTAYRRACYRARAVCSAQKMMFIPASKERLPRSAAWGLWREALIHNTREPINLR